MDMNNIFLKHNEWATSDGEKGEKLEIEHTKMSGIDIRGTNLSCSLIVESNLDRAILTHNDMSDGYFLSTSFDGADLSDSLMSKAVFDYASLKEAILKNCIGIKASFEEANLSSADLSAADLRRASFRKANLSHANFAGADVTGAILDGALLYGTSFKDAKGIDEVSANYVIIGTEAEPVRLEGEEVHHWLLEQRRG
ncbi:pentapeptide repeat-containing protein [Paenibacillus motobuensis]|uniref:pentapeptide repeat-containing protein n=1 Tax=Paenibacillus TaxID=44249 RepID=UPI002041359E|nr:MULTISPECIES: pentapeptide repeat-containing protein [Paenibacillus]MCM3039494.1 pentapeptide repeat-containing protein [Paenibacillus lutimineralis]MCM3646598.1 pentapeptide repeat-containing protein [Paenibacillus motobuensis]